MMMQDAANKKKSLFGGLKNCNSGDTGSGYLERVFWEGKKSGAYKAKNHKVVKKLPGENYH